jgi:hypothetical protein
MMSVARLRYLPLLGAVVALSPGCAPAIASMTMPNPARAAVTTQATQSYEIPPFKEEHRYEVTLASWTPSTVEFRVHLLSSEGCGLPSSYFIDLVDDQGGRHLFRARGEERATPISGHLGARLFDTTVEGDVGVAVDARTRFVILELRPKADRACAALDFRWNFGD